MVYIVTNTVWEMPYIDDGEVKEEDIPQEWFDKFLDNICSKSCSALNESYRKMSAPGCYAGVGTACLTHCDILQAKCEEKQKELCRCKESDE